MADKDPALNNITDDGKGMEVGEELRAKAAKRPFLSRELYLRILVLILVLGVTVAIFVFRDRVANLAGYGYLGAFLISLLSSATIILPVHPLFTPVRVYAHIRQRYSNTDHT